MRFGLMVAGLAILGSQLRADSLYVGTSTGVFGIYDTVANTVDTLATNSTVLYGLGFNDGNLYGNDSNAPSSLYTVNTSNGSLTLVGLMNNAGSGAGTLASAPGGGTLYYADHSNDLYTINPGTAQLSEVGPMGLSVGGGYDLNYGPDGNLYEDSSGSLYKINTTTGAGTLIGSFGSSLEMQSIVAADGKLYGFDGTGMYSIDLTDGAATFVRNTPAGIGNFDSETQIPASGTPEPGSAVLLLIGLSLGALGVRRGRTA